jgi:hypothetical protein
MIDASEFHHHLARTETVHVCVSLSAYVQWEHRVAVLFAVDLLRVHPVDEVKIVGELRNPASRSSCSTAFTYVEIGTLAVLMAVRDASIEQHWNALGQVFDQAEQWREILDTFQVQRFFPPVHSERGSVRCRSRMPTVREQWSSHTRLSAWHRWPDRERSRRRRWSRTERPWTAASQRTRHDQLLQPDATASYPDD